MSVQRQGAAGEPWFPPASTFSWGWHIPAAILEPLLRPAQGSGGAAPEGPSDPVRSADGRDTELPAG
jgi:hypothetical protein